MTITESLTKDDKSFMTLPNRRSGLAFGYCRSIYSFFSAIFISIILSPLRKALHNSESESYANEAYVARFRNEKRIFSKRTFNIPMASLLLLWRYGSIGLPTKKPQPAR